MKSTLERKNAVREEDTQRTEGKSGPRSEPVPKTVNQSQRQKHLRRHMFNTAVNGQSGPFHVLDSPPTGRHFGRHLFHASRHV
eukprot:459374-Pleurochrysis_carterae.AAC.1